MEKESRWNLVRFKIDTSFRDVFQTHPVLLANSAGVFQVACPSEAQRAHLEVPIREHVSQAERVVILFCKGRRTSVRVCVCVCVGFATVGKIDRRFLCRGQQLAAAYAMRREGEVGEDLFTREQLQILFHAVVARESIIGISQCVLAVNFHTFYHEADVVGPPVLVEVYRETNRDRREILGKKKRRSSRLACMFVNRVDPLHVPRHHFDASLLRAVSREKLVIRLQVEHARSLPRVHRRAFVQVSRDTIPIRPSALRKHRISFLEIDLRPQLTRLRRAKM